MAAEIPTEWMHGTSLRPGDVADIFKVDRATITKWANAGIIGFFRTPYGERRYPESEVERVMKGTEPAPEFLKELAEADQAKYRAKRAEGGWHAGLRPYSE